MLALNLEKAHNRYEGKGERTHACFELGRFNEELITLDVTSNVCIPKSGTMNDDSLIDAGSEAD